MYYFYYFDDKFLCIAFGVQIPDNLTQHDCAPDGVPDS